MRVNERNSRNEGKCRERVEKKQLNDIEREVQQRER